MSYSSKLLTNAPNMVPGHSACTYSENLYCTRSFWKVSHILKKETENIQFCLRQMEDYLTDLPTTYFDFELTGSSGATGQIILTIKPCVSLKKSVSSGSSSKKRQKKNLRSGKRSRGLK